MQQTTIHHGAITKGVQVDGKPALYGEGGGDNERATQVVIGRTVTEQGHRGRSGNGPEEDDHFLAYFRWTFLIVRSPLHAQ